MLTKAQTRQTTAQTGKTSAETINIEKNEAPSGDPFWYRDLKNAVKRIRQNPSLLVPFGGIKK